MFLLAIESSCDDTSVAVVKDGKPLSNVVSSQLVHATHGGVVPEMASREHQKNILRVTGKALELAGKTAAEMDAVAVTIGPGLPGSLLVGVSFAKGLALSLGKPLIAVNHMEAHILSLLIHEQAPAFPFLCLVVSGGHTLLVDVRNWNDMRVLGRSKDDAVGEAFDKCAKLLGLGYPGGKAIDDLARDGNPAAFRFPVGMVDGFDFSYSGVKTAVMYFIREKEDAFVNAHLADIAASIQHALLKPLVTKAMQAMNELGYQRLGIAGGVAANSGLRRWLAETCSQNSYQLFIPDFQFCTDNAAMIGQAGWYKWKHGLFASLQVGTHPRLGIGETI